MAATPGRAAHGSGRPDRPLLSLQLVCPGHERSGHGRQHLKRELFEWMGPGLLQVFGDPGELAQMVHVAERVTACPVAPVAPPDVLDGPAPKLGQAANGLGGAGATLGMQVP